MKHIKKYNESQDYTIGTRMSVKELIDHLSQFDENLEVMILDGFNGGGNKRSINYSPDEPITVAENEKGHDCEGKTGKKVVILGYGCY